MVNKLSERLNDGKNLLVNKHLVKYAKIGYAEDADKIIFLPIAAHEASGKGTENGYWASM